jgi:hypothetical protein
MSNYRFGFSPLGLGFYALQLLPNLIWLWAPPANNVLAANTSPYPLLNVSEGFFGFLTVALLVLLTNKNAGGAKVYLRLAVLFLGGYYLAWILYYLGVVCPWLLIIGLAAMPPLYFLFVALWLKNHAVIITSLIFGAAHLAVTCLNYLRL